MFIRECNCYAKSSKIYTTHLSITIVPITIADYIHALATPEWVEEKIKPKNMMKERDELAQRFAEIIACYNEGQKEKAHHLIKAVVERFPTRVGAWVAYSGFIKL